MHEYDTPTENVKQANQQTNRSLKTSTLTSYRAFQRSTEAEYTILNIQYDSARRLHIWIYKFMREYDRPSQLKFLPLPLLVRSHSPSRFLRYVHLWLTWPCNWKRTFSNHTRTIRRHSARQRIFSIDLPVFFTFAFSKNLFRIALRSKQTHDATQP